MASEHRNLKNRIHELFMQEGIELNVSERKFVDIISFAVDEEITQTALDICKAFKGES